MPDSLPPGFSVLVTRPREQAGDLVREIESRGGRAIVFPCIEIVPRPEEDVAKDAAALPEADITIYISRNAVLYGAMHASGQVAAIGPTTAQALTEAGLTVDIFPQSGFDSESLLAEASFSGMDGKNVRIVRGGAGRELLASELENRGAKVDYLDAYGRQAPRYTNEEVEQLASQFEQGEVDAIVIMSVESLDNLLTLLPESCHAAVSGTPLVSPSARVIKNVLERFPANPAVTADGTRVSNIVDALATLAADSTTRPPEDTMSESETDERNSVSADADFDEADSAQPQSAESPTEPARKSGGGITSAVAWLALLVAVVASLAAGYLAWDNWRSARAAADEAGEIAALRSRTESEIAGTRESLDDLQSSLDALRSSGSEDSATLDALQEDMDKLSADADLLDSITPRVRNLERSVANLQGVSIDVRNTYLLAEAEYYMQIANAQLQLAGNPELASLALEQADDRLSQLGDPALTDVRRALADELAALDGMENPDIAGVTLTLASLAQVADSLPLRQANGDESANTAEDPDETGGVERAWNAVKGAMSGLVTYTRPGEEDAPLLAPEAEPMIRSNLSLQLQSARLALLRGEQEIFEQSLADADRWIEHYFDTSATAVSSARDTLAEISADYRQVTPPDISESLRLLRQYQTLAETEE